MAVLDFAASVFRDWETYGVPASGPHDPVKAEIRALFAQVVTLIGSDDIPAGLADDIAAIAGQIESVQTNADLSEAAKDDAVAAAAAALADRLLAQAAANDAAESRDQAMTYAELTGPFLFYATKAEANAALAGLPANQMIQVWVDESQSNTRTVYKKVGGVYVLQASFAYVAAAALAADSGSSLVGFLPLAVGADARTVEDKLRDVVSVLDFPGVVGDGVNDDRVGLQAAIDATAAEGQTLKWLGLTHNVSWAADPDHYCLDVPSNSVWDVSERPLIKAADGLISWKRVVRIQDVSNVRIIGSLDVDGNVDNISGTNNEHMHGVFIFDATDIDIDAVRSTNCRGDNVFIGGTDNTAGSQRIRIGNLTGVTCGRKNLVLQNFDEVEIGTAFLDNDLGGSDAVPDGLGGGCFDIEPDANDGSVMHRLHIGSIVARGTSMDFTAGTTAAQAENFVVRVDGIDFRVKHRAGVNCWVQNAITMNLGAVRIWNAQTIIAVQYGARLRCESLEFSTAINDFSMLVAAVGSDRPVVRFGTLRINNRTVSYGQGIENRDAEVVIGDFYPNTTNTASWTRGLSSTAGIYANTVIGRVFSNEAGNPDFAADLLTVSKAGSNIPNLTVGEVHHRDTRAAKLAKIVTLQASTPGSGVNLGLYNDYGSGVPLVGWADSTGYVRTGAYSYLTKGTPEAMVAAVIGSTAQRTDGGAGTSLYVKESGTGNTGWAAK